MIGDVVRALEYVVRESFWNGSRFTQVDDVVTMDCLSADILVKYDVVLPVMGRRQHEWMVRAYGSVRVPRGTYSQTEETYSPKKETYSQPLPKGRGVREEEDGRKEVLRKALRRSKLRMALETGPEGTQTQEAYSPKKETYSPTQEAYSPTQEAYSPTQETYSPTQETYSPTSYRVRTLKGEGEGGREKMGGLLIRGLTQWI